MKRLFAVVLLALAGCAPVATAPHQCHNYNAQPGQTVTVTLEAGCTDTIYVGRAP